VQPTRLQVGRLAERQVAPFRQRLRQLLRAQWQQQRARSAQRQHTTEPPSVGACATAARACWWLSISAVLTTTSSGLRARNASKMLPAPGAEKERRETCVDSVQSNEQAQMSMHPQNERTRVADDERRAAN
jgi:hypothetical protein